MKRKYGNSEKNDPMYKEARRLDTQISRMYGLSGRPVPDEKVWLAGEWLRSGIEEALLRAEDMEARRTEIEAILKSSSSYREIAEMVRMDEVVRAAEIRKDFASALRGVKEGRELAPILSWGFTKGDLRNLAALHRSGRFRRKIEDLLADCNFHTERTLMAEKDYSTWLDVPAGKGGGK